MRRHRALLLALLAASVLAPIVFLSSTPASSLGGKEFADEISNTVSTPDILSSSDALQLNSLDDEGWDGVKEPVREVLEEFDSASSNSSVAVSLSVLKDQGNNSTAAVDDGSDKTVIGVPTGASTRNAHAPPAPQNSSVSSPKLDGAPKMPTQKRSDPSRAHTDSDEKIREMKDELIMAKAYLLFAPPNSNSHFVKELRLRIKESERVVSQTNRDSNLSRSALQKKRAMEASLAKAGRVYPDCSAMATKLRSLAYNSEEQLKAQQKQASHLLQLAGRTFPKGLHCLSMRLTAEYFSLQPEERDLPNIKKVKQRDLHHYVVFSDNVLACAVVINSTVSTSKEPERIVLHVVTDSLNYPAISMWFLINPPGKATIHVVNVDDFGWVSSSYNSIMRKTDVKDPRFSSVLNHLRFYLPKIFPYLDKVLFLDHDVVVQKDLRGLWRINMKGKVIGAVEMCRDGESYHHLEMYIDFSDPLVAKSFDPKRCSWAFGMNMIDLREWRRRGLTSEYHKWLQVAKKRQLWKAGSLPMGQVTFYNDTLLLDRRWHAVGLGYDSNIGREKIERAAVIHYDGVMKPWLEIGVPRYRSYWSKFLNYDHPHLLQCNIHQ